MVCAGRCLLLALILVAQSGIVAAYTDLFFFGDSLSDIGNTQAATSSTIFFVYPGSHYYEGRFSNGPVYAELLSQQMGMGTLTRSSAGGNNFAYGGAKTLGTSGITGSFINDLGEQVDDYTSTRDADAGALYILWAGANDLFDGQLDMSIPVGNITSDIQQLYDDGARQFLVLNLPKLGATPAYNGTAVSRADWNKRTLAFNTELSSGLDSLENSLSQISINRFDVESLFDSVLASPSTYGLTNATIPAAPGLEPGNFLYNDDNIVENPDEYLFWDEVHPTAVMHSALADAIYDFLIAPEVLEGDFNNDRVVNMADYTVWRDNLGAVAEAAINFAGNGQHGVDVADYALWKTSFDEMSSSPGPQAMAPVPEPLAAILAVFASFLLMGKLKLHACPQQKGAAPCWPLPGY